MQKGDKKITKVFKWIAIVFVGIIVLNTLNGIVNDSMDKGNMTDSVYSTTKGDMYTAYKGSSGIINAIDSISDSFDYSDESSAVEEEVVAPEWNENNFKMESSTSSLNAPSDEKLVYEANSIFETKDIHSAIDFVHDVIEQTGGIIQSERIDNLSETSYQNATAKIYVRIPQMSYTTFLSALQEEKGGLSLKSIDKNVENMTETYSDIESRLRSLRTQEARLIEFMKSANNVEEMLEIEEQLSDVQYEIEKYTNSKNGIDYDVKYSKITVNIIEVKEYTETPVEKKNFFERVWTYIKGSAEEFGETLEGMLEYTIYLIPNLFLLFLFFIFGRFIVKAVRKKIKKSKSNIIEDKEENSIILDKENSELDENSGEIE